MAYLLLDDYRVGLDVRRSRFSSAPGTLREAANVHLTRGAEIEKRKAFALYNDIDPATIGLYANRNGLLTFSNDPSVGPLPAGVDHQRLDPGTASPLISVTARTLFNGIEWVVGNYEDNTAYPFYDGDLIADFTDGIYANPDTAQTARDEIRSQIDAHTLVTQLGFSTANGTSAQFTLTGPIDEDFEMDAFVTDINDPDRPTFGANEAGGIALTVTQDPTAAGDAVSAQAQFQITTGATDDGGGPPVVYNGLTSLEVSDGPTELLNAAVTWAGSASATAGAVVSSINAATGTHGYSAGFTGNLVTVYAPSADGSAANGRTLAFVNDAGVQPTLISNFAAGVTSSGGTGKRYLVEFPAPGTRDAFKITVTYEGRTYRFGASQVAGLVPKAAVTLKGKVYFIQGSYLYFSALNDATSFDDEAGTAGFINLRNEFFGADELTGLGVYQSNLAIFARRQVFIYYVDQDPALNRQLQVLNNTGTLAPQSVVSVGDVDVFYLSDTGVRSLRARDSSNLATVSDVGTPVDDLIVEALRTLPEEQIETAIGFIEPNDGRYWLRLGEDMIYVFTTFAASKVAAWTKYETPFDVQDFALFQGRLYTRGGDDAENDHVYLHGGENNDEWDDSVATVILPFMDAKAPADRKVWCGFDGVFEGAWKVYLATNMQDPDRYELIGVLDGSTFDIGKIAVAGESTHAAIKLVHDTAEYARIGPIALHYVKHDPD